MSEQPAEVPDFAWCPRCGRFLRVSKRRGDSVRLYPHKSGTGHWCSLAMFDSPPYPR